MTHKEYLDLLQQNVEQWNAWRLEHPEIRPCLNMNHLDGTGLSQANLRGIDLILAHLKQADLSEADLSEADLSEADLSEADLSEADLKRTNLSEADLSGANLSGANLSGANLSGANLSGANLWGVNLRGACLVGANLKKADLSAAILNRTDMHGADVTFAWIEETHFANLDLRPIKGLEQLQHRGPSTIGIDTLYRSQGQIPERFLRQAGVPDDFLSSFPLFVNKHNLTDEDP